MNMRNWKTKSPSYANELTFVARRNHYVRCREFILRCRRSGYTPRRFWIDSSSYSSKQKSFLDNIIGSRAYRKTASSEFFLVPYKTNTFLILYYTGIDYRPFCAFRTIYDENCDAGQKVLNICTSESTNLYITDPNKNSPKTFEYKKSIDL